MLQICGPGDALETPQERIRGGSDSSGSRELVQVPFGVDGCGMMWRDVA